MTSLYKITEEYQEALNMMTDMEMSADEIKDSLSALTGEFETKAINCIRVEKNMAADIDAISNEIKRLTDKKKAITNKRESFKEYIRSNMESSGINKISSPLFTITLRKALQVAVIDDEDLISSDYKVDVPASTKVDKKALLAALKLGDVKGASLKYGNRGLLIK